MSKSKKPETKYMHEVLDALGYDSRFCDATAKGYRIKLWTNIHSLKIFRKTEKLLELAAKAQWVSTHPDVIKYNEVYRPLVDKENARDIKKLQKKLNQLGYTNVEVCLRGMDDYVSLIIPYSK